MKKIALTSLIAMFAFAGAHAANVIDGNPLYMPKKGHFYSVTELGSHTKGDTPWGLGEEFGYGVTDRLAVVVDTTLIENNEFDDFAWNDAGISVAFRALDMKGWKLDAIAGYSVDNLYNHPKPLGEDAWFDKDLTNYTWTLGVRGGYAASNWTVAGHALFTYENTKSFNWNEDAVGDKGIHTIILGLDGQYVLNKYLNLVAGVEYTGALDDNVKGDPLLPNKNEGTWEGTFGVNYNIDATKFVGAYISGSLNHHGGANADEWDWDEGFGFGAKFGIDF